MNKKLTSAKLLVQAIKSCKYQQDLSLDSVKRYITCFRYLEKRDNVITPTDIWYLSNISSKNSGYRYTPVTFKNGDFGVKSEFIERQLCILCKFLQQNPDEFFIEFEKVHPYNDGNGRVGEIIYYWMTGNFNTPKFHG